MSELPLPVANEDTQAFWDGCRRHELLLQQCTSCDALRYPPQPACAECGSLESGWQPASGRGTVFSYVIAHQAVHPALTDRVPFATVLVQLDEGPLMTSNLTGVAPAEIAIGMPVEVTFEEREDVTLPVFRLR